MKYQLSIFHFLIPILFMGCNEMNIKEHHPNIIIILADDLGYGEIGVQGQQKIRTPHIDKLANTGMRFTNHYSGAPVCAPARYVLLTGQHTGHAYIRGNDEWVERGDVWNYEKACQDSTLEGQRPIPAETNTIAKLLKKKDYATGIYGKWGLGAPGTEGVPNFQGFDHFYGYNCQRQAHNLFPPHLWANQSKELLDNKIIKPHTKLDSTLNPWDEESYAAYHQNEYAPEKIHEKSLEFIKTHSDKPFFLYYASPLPHLPLQAPKNLVEHYQNMFGDEEPYVGDKGYFPNRYPRACYAAMISYLDQQVGEIIETLKEQGIYENTLIIFTSDNGPTYTGGVDFEYFESSSPFSNGYGKTKGFVYEGGIHVPFIVSWPGKIEAGITNKHVSAFYDLLPTICDITEIEPPQGIDGISMKASFFGEEQNQHEYLYWEFPSYNGQQAVRMSHWKGIRKNIFDGNLSIELYDLEADPSEKTDISKTHPEIVSRIENIMKNQHKEAINPRFKFEVFGEN